MKQIHFRVRDETLQQLDKLAKEKGFSSRSELLTDIIETYVLLGDRSLLTAVPPTVKALCASELQQLNEQSELAVENAIVAIKRLTLMVEKLELLLSD